MKKAILLFVFAFGSTMAFASNTDPKVLLVDDASSLAHQAISKINILTGGTLSVPESSEKDVPCVYCSSCGSTVVCVICNCGNCNIELDFLGDRLCELGCCYDIR
ncbi:MAG: hypothetical protein KIS77_15220 [Saprospiraceae bacterium]|nr:hypothetical protein [Saprospiraceae bacterium]